MLSEDNSRKGAMELSRFKGDLVESLPRLQRFGLSLSASKDTAQELVQATAMRALTRHHQFRNGTRLDSWLFSIMHSIWKNELRAAHIRQGEGFVPLEEVSAESPASRPDESLYHQELRGAILALPEAQRLVVLLVYIEGYAYREAAEILEIPIGTVMSRLARARLALAERLDMSAATITRGRPADGAQP